MAAYDTGKMILFVRSVMWDLKIPPEAATVMTKTTTHVRRWATHKNQQPELDTWI
jgi:hypothetical protein